MVHRWIHTGIRAQVHPRPCPAKGKVSYAAAEVATFLTGSERSATACFDRLASNVLALVRDQEGGELRDVFRLLNAAELDVALDADGLRLSDANTLLQSW